jgi:cytochrome oxidase assembly protein ShyY1
MTPGPARRAGGLLLALAGAAAFASLGAWQLGRANTKEQLVAAWQAALAAAPAPADGVLRDADSLPPRTAGTTPDTGPALPLRVTARGRFDAARTFVLDNQVRDGRAGIAVLAVFELDELPGGRALLVNRGWLPLDAARTPPAIDSGPADPVAIDGLLVAPPARGLRPAAHATGAFLPWLDVGELEQASHRDLFEGILLLSADSPLGYRRDWQPLPNTLPPERHRGYAVQWFALALAVLVVWAVVAFRRR